MTCRLAVQSDAFRALSQLPASQRSLLDEQALRFLGHLWRALKRDEPHTAAALLEPPPPSLAQSEGTEDEETHPSLCALFADEQALCPLFPPPDAAHTSSSAAASSHCSLDGRGGGGVAGGFGGGGAAGSGVWDMGAVRTWMESRVLAYQGFSDQLVVDAICRRLEEHAAHAASAPNNYAPAPAANATNGATPCTPHRLADCRVAATDAEDGAATPAPPEVASALLAAETLDGSSLTNYAALFLDSNATPFVQDLRAFLRSPAAAATSHAHPPPHAPPHTLPTPTADGASTSETGSTTSGPAASRLPAGIAEWCDPSRAPGRLAHVSPVSAGLLLLSRDSARRGAAHLLRLGPSRSLAPLARLSPGALYDLRAAWHAPNGALVRVGDALLLLHASGAISPVTRLPKHTRSLDATWPPDGILTLAALVAAPSGIGGAIAVSPGPEATVQLQRFTPMAGWESLCAVAPAADSIALSQTGRHCGWRVPGRGGRRDAGGGEAAHDTAGWGTSSEFFVAELRPSAEPRAVTQGAGSCGAIRLSPDGSAIAYLATHDTGGAHGGGGTRVGGSLAALWWVPWEGGAPPVQLSPRGACVLDFGWVPAEVGERDAAAAAAADGRRRGGGASGGGGGGRGGGGGDGGSEGSGEGGDSEEGDDAPPPLRLWMTLLRGLHALTWLVNTEGVLLSQLELPVALGGAPLWLPNGRLVQLTESAQRPLTLWDGAALTPLPSAGSDAVARLAPEATVTRLCCADGAPLPALLFSTRRTAAGAPTVLHLLSSLPDEACLGLASRVLRFGSTPEPGDEATNACGLANCVLPLLAAGYRVLAICTRPVASGPAAGSSTASRTPPVDGAELSTLHRGGGCDSSAAASRASPVDGAELSTLHRGGGCDAPQRAPARGSDAEGAAFAAASLSSTAIAAATIGPAAGAASTIAAAAVPAAGVAAPGTGEEGRVPLGDTGGWPSAAHSPPVADVLAALDQLDRTPSAGPPHQCRPTIVFGLLGAGHGAYVALCALAASERPFGAAVVAGAYVCPFLRDLELGRGGAQAQARSTLVEELHAIRTPLLLLHGAPPPPPC